MVERVSVASLVRAGLWLRSPPIEGFDQKPVHVNESGRHMRKTLGWKGSAHVPLKEAQSQTRERWTLNTHVCSDLSVYLAHPPMEDIFKRGKVVGLRVEATLQQLREEEGLAPLTWFSVAIGPKGSYRKHHRFSSTSTGTGPP